MMVTTGARGRKLLGRAGLGLGAQAGLDFLLECHDLGLEAELLDQLDAELGLDDEVDVGHDAALHQQGDQVLRLDLQAVGEVAQRHALGDDHRAVLERATAADRVDLRILVTAGLLAPPAARRERTRRDDRLIDDVLDLHQGAAQAPDVGGLNLDRRLATLLRLLLVAIRAALVAALRAAGPGGRRHRGGRARAAGAAGAAHRRPAGAAGVGRPGSRRSARARPGGPQGRDPGGPLGRLPGGPPGRVAGPEGR